VIRVLLADDQALLRAGFRMLLEAAADIEVVGEAPNGGVAVALARRHHPDVVLMDLRMPDVDGATATALIAGDPALSGVRVIVLTTFDDDESVFTALRAGASGFLVKDTEPDDLLHAVRVVARGDALLSPSVTRAVISRFTAPPPPSVPRPDGSPAGRPAPAERPGPAEPLPAERPLPAGQPVPAARPVPLGLATLTEREREVVSLVAAGLSNDEIAARLTVSPLTAKTHVSRAMTKLAARDRAQLVVLAYEHGLAPRPG
jgi:DNA-binding NarL/FixJ family response regulator